MTRSLLRNNRRVAIATALASLLCVGSFFSASTARASAPISAEESLPAVLESTQLVLGAVSERIGANGVAFASASSVSDPQIAALMELLNQLIAMYQAILASQQGKVNDEDDTDEGSVPGADTSIEVLSPNGGELHTDGERMIISWTAAKNLMPVDIHLIARDSGNSFSIKQNHTPTRAMDKNSITWLVDGSHDAQKDTHFKIKICQAGTYTSSTCDTSDKYFTILANYDDEPTGEDSSVSSSFSYTQDFSGGSQASRLMADFSYTIDNYRAGLVLDVEPTVNCDDSMLAPPYARDCSHYLFDLSGKAAEKYVGVKADPYVRGGAVYRFTGANGQLYIVGYQQPLYIVLTPYIVPEPDSVEFRFILRDLNDGGRILWSETKVAQFKG